MSLPELQKLLENDSRLDPRARERVGVYYTKLIQENEIQNLTRLTKPQDFIEGHLEDVLQLEKTGWIQGEALDLGSGCGVPGLLAACVNPLSQWFLAESEIRKREFLERTVEEMGFNARVRVGARGEDILRREKISIVVTRAVAKLGKLWSLLSNCSTWNTLILFKGPSWNEEWQEFLQKSDPTTATTLQIEESFHYTVGLEQKKRILVRLARVPRGTST